MSFFAWPGGEFGEQPLQPVDGLDPSPGEFLATIGEHPQRLELDVVGQHAEALGADRDRCGRVCVVGVGLALVAGVEQPCPRRELGRHVDHVLAVGQQALRHQPPGTVAALNRPDQLGPCRDDPPHRCVSGLVGAEPTLRQHLLVTLDDLDRRRQLVGIDPDREPHPKPRVGSRKASIPPTAWTESGRTPVLTESSNSRDSADRHQSRGALRLGLGSCLC